ncbi:hypothetical protein R6Q59_003482 [Mikania micrantha]
MTHSSYSEENNKAFYTLGESIIFEITASLRLLTKDVDISLKDLNDQTKTPSSGKYTTTQSDPTGRCFVNLNVSDEEVEMDMPPPTSTQRPPGRNSKSKQPQASSSSDYKDTLETISNSLQKFVNLQEQKQYNNDMKLFWTPTDH